MSGKPERLQKVLAHAGLGSRRACEELILQGRVSVDGAVVRQLGTRVDPAKARIQVDGESIQLERTVYFAVNKPKGYVSTNLDPAGRPRVVDLLPEIPQRVYTVGRLDEESTGLMILTNDGDLANRLAHPRYGVEKTYRALVAGLPDRGTIAKLTEGVWLSDGKVRAKRARMVARQGQATMLELVLAEGKKREVRRMLSKLGHKVMSLCRLAVGPVTLHGLAAGECRPLSRHEVDMLRRVAAGAATGARARGPRSQEIPSRRGPKHRQAGRSSLPQKRARPPLESTPTVGGPQQRPQVGRSRRRIIGLQTGELAAMAGGSAGRSVRKRPPGLKRRPPRAALGVKPQRSAHDGSSEPEDSPHP